MTSQDNAAAETDGYVVVQHKHPARWAAALVVAILFGLLIYSMASNPRFGWDQVELYFRDTTIINGIGITIGLTAVCMAVGVALGVVLAVMRLSVNPLVKTAASAYVGFFRGTPVLVQLLFWFNLAALYPDITFGIPGLHLDANSLITPMLAAVLGLGLNEAAYMSEIVRAGIVSVDDGQGEASAALGLTRMQTMRKVILPQAMRVIIPPTGNEVIGMLKTTSLVSVIAVPELLYSSQIIYSKNFQVIPLLLVASIWYIVITTIFGVGQYYLERHFARGSRRNLPPSLLAKALIFMRTHAPLAVRKAPLQ